MESFAQDIEQLRRVLFTNPQYSRSKKESSRAYTQEATLNFNTKSETAKLLAGKLDKGVTTDDIPEGKNNKYWNPSDVSQTINARNLWEAVSSTGIAPKNGKGIEIADSIFTDLTLKSVYIGENITYGAEGGVDPEINYLMGKDITATGKRHWMIGETLEGDENCSDLFIFGSSSGATDSPNNHIVASSSSTFESPFTTLYGYLLNVSSIDNISAFGRNMNITTGNLYNVHLGTDGAGERTQIHGATVDIINSLTGTSAIFSSTVTGNGFFTLASQGSSTNSLTRKDYVDGLISGLSGTYLPLTGGTLTGQLNGTTAHFSSGISINTSLSPATGRIYLGDDNDSQIRLGNNAMNDWFIIKHDIPNDKLAILSNDNSTIVEIDNAGNADFIGEIEAGSADFSGTVVVDKLTFDSTSSINPSIDYNTDLIITGTLNNDVIYNARPNGADEGHKWQINGVEKASLLLDGSFKFQGDVTIASGKDLSVGTDLTVNNDFWCKGGAVRLENLPNSAIGLTQGELYDTGDGVVRRKQP